MQWDVLVTFVTKYVAADWHGNYGPGNGWYPKFPQPPDRILDSVRRSGGWKTYACMTEEDFPFVQKRFFEEYRAWSAVNARTTLIAGTGEDNRRQLAGTIQSAVKRMPHGQTRGELRERREQLSAEVTQLRSGCSAQQKTECARMSPLGNEESA